MLHWQSVDELYTYENEHKDIKFIFKFSSTFMNFIDKQQAADQPKSIGCDTIEIYLVE